MLGNIEHGVAMSHCKHCRGNNGLWLQNRSTCRIVRPGVFWSMTHLSELGPGFLLFHPSVGHQVVKYLSWIRRTENTSINNNTIVSAKSAFYQHCCSHKQFPLTLCPNKFSSEWSEVKTSYELHSQVRS